MKDNSNHDSNGRSGEIRPDGGLSDVEREKQIDYLDVEINLFKPGTPFMRDHSRLIVRGFILWAVLIFGPITATKLAPDMMTATIPGIGFPLHYFLIAVVGPAGALLLSVWYVRARDNIDEKYGIEQIEPVEPDAADAGAEGAAATDGGVDE